MASSVYVVDLRFNTNTSEVQEMIHESLPKMPSPALESFANKCDGRFVVGGGKDRSYNVSKSVFEYEPIERKWKRLPPLNIPRFRAASCYNNGILYVSGGFDEDSEVIDSIEYLEISRYDNGPKWKICETCMPIPLTDHTFSALNGKIILMGGNTGDRGRSGKSNNVWQGTPHISNQHSSSTLHLEWQPLDRMSVQRDEHFATSVKNEIHVFGGSSNEEDHIEIFDGHQWELGPRIPSELSTYNAQVVVDTSNRIIITTKDGIITYDTKENIVNECIKSTKKWFDRSSYSALLY